MKYRMYIDEVGNSDLGAWADPNQCYLSFAGVVFEHSPQGRIEG